MTDIIRAILLKPGKLTRKDRRIMELEVIRAPMNNTRWADDGTFLEMCNFVLYASKRALIIRFLY